jgi:hypothetical protein
MSHQRHDLSQWKQVGGGDGRRLVSEQGLRALQAARPDVGGGRGAERSSLPYRSPVAARERRADGIRL